VNLADTSALVHAVLAEHGLHDWNFVFNRRKRAFGMCDYTRRTIFLSSVLTELNGEAEVRDTLLHEVAHALAGHRAGHGPAWQKVAREIGAKLRRCYDAEEVRQPPARYLLVCPSCRQVTPRHRKLKGVYACRRCCERLNGGRFSERYRLELRKG
jgi:predicted SprT family Zn-dependent metalloprotease